MTFSIGGLTFTPMQLRTLAGIYTSKWGVANGIVTPTERPQAGYTIAAWAPGAHNGRFRADVRIKDARVWTAGIAVRVNRAYEPNGTIVPAGDLLQYGGISLGLRTAQPNMQTYEDDYYGRCGLAEGVRKPRVGMPAGQAVFLSQTRRVDSMITVGSKHTIEIDFWEGYIQAYLDGALFLTLTGATPVAFSDLSLYAYLGEAPANSVEFTNVDFVAGGVRFPEVMADTYEAATAPAVVSLTAGLLSFRDPYADHAQDWFDDHTDANTGNYQAIWAKLYRVRTLVDITSGSTWTPPAQAIDNRGDGSGFALELDLFNANPGDPTHEGFGRNTGVADWDHNDTYVTYTNRSSPSGGSLGDPEAIRTTIPAGTMVWVLAQQWPDTYSSGPIAAPPVSWNPKVDMGTWADPDGNPFTPWDPSAMIQVELPVPSDQWLLTPTDFDGAAQPPAVDLFQALSPAGGGDGGMTISPRSGEYYALRIYSLDGSQPTDGGTLSWTSVPRAVQVTVPQPTVSPLSTLMVAVANEVPGDTLTLTLDNDPTVVGIVVVDDDGTATYPVALPVLTPGAHLVNITSSSGAVGNMVFTVKTDPTAMIYPPDAPEPTPPPVPAQAVPNQWFFADPTNGDLHQFNVNPDKADSVMRPRAFTTEHTADPKGQPLVFEGAPRPRNWSFSGTLFSLSEIAALKSWKRPYRLYLVDDLNRAFIVRVLNVKTQPKRDTGNPETHTFEVDCVLYARVV